MIHANDMTNAMTIVMALPSLFVGAVLVGAAIVDHVAYKQDNDRAVALEAIKQRNVKRPNAMPALRKQCNAGVCMSTWTPRK